MIPVEVIINSNSTFIGYYGFAGKTAGHESYVFLHTGLNSVVTPATGIFANIAEISNMPNEQGISLKKLYHIKTVQVFKFLAIW